MVDKIFLVGFRAVGKSTTGKLLAKKLGWKLVEMDALIEKKAQQTISELVALQGWPAFRKLETEILAECENLQNVVISCGGGVGVNDILDSNTGKTFGQLQSQILDKIQNKTVVLLTAKTDTIKKRLMLDYQKKVSNRPSLDNISHQDILSKITKDIEVWQQREPMYQKLTQIQVSAEQKNVINEILCLI